MPVALKPCPFCGKTNIKTGQDDELFFFVSCDDDDCNIVEAHSIISLERAIEDWNTRAIEDKLLEACQAQIAAWDYDGDSWNMGPEDSAAHSREVNLRLAQAEELIRDAVRLAAPGESEAQP